jgi:hypothetical protein
VSPLTIAPLRSCPGGKGLYHLPVSSLVRWRTNESTYRLVLLSLVCCRPVIPLTTVRSQGEHTCRAQHGWSGGPSGIEGEAPSSAPALKPPLRRWS